MGNRWRTTKFGVQELLHQRRKLHSAPYFLVLQTVVVKHDFDYPISELLASAFFFQRKENVTYTFKVYKHHG